jgi:hypothetical protein
MDRKAMRINTDNRRIIRQHTDERGDGIMKGRMAGIWMGRTHLDG